MQAVTSAWKANQEETFVSESYVELTFKMNDPTAQYDGTVTVNGEESFSDASEILTETDKSPVKYATLERNLWSLDGTAEIAPSSAPYGKQGYIGSAVSNGNGTYAINPKITMTFSRVFSDTIQGVTINWGTAYGEGAESFTVTAYNGSTVVATKTVTGNKSTKSVVLTPISGYNKIEIEVLRWEFPVRRARAQDITLGVILVYDKSNLITYTHTMAVDPLTGILPDNTITFEIANLNQEYNPDNPDSLTQYVMERQKVTARYGYKINGNIEWIKGGTFFMSGWEFKQNGITANFTARDAIEYMSALYTGRVNGTLAQIATAAFTQADLPTLPDGSNMWSIDSSLESINAPSGVALPDGTTIAEVLQYVANAARCVMYQDRNGIFHIEPLPLGTTDYVIDRNNSYQNAETTLTKQTGAINVNQGLYVLTIGAGEVQDVQNPFVSATQAPAYAVWIAAYLAKRKNLTGEFRADPRLDALDRVSVTNQFATNNVLITSIRYNYNGAFKGEYEGRAEA